MLQLALVHVQFAAVPESSIFTLYLTLWGMEPAVTHQTPWLESAESTRALTIENSVTELLRMAGDVFRHQASLGQICDCLHCRAVGLLCPVLCGSPFCCMHDMSSGDV